MTPAFGGQYSIQLSYGRLVGVAILQALRTHMPWKEPTTRNILITLALGCAPLFSIAAHFDVNNPTGFQTALTTAQANGENDTINVAAGSYNVATNGTLTYTAAENENFGLIITGSTVALTELNGGMQVPILRIDSTAVINDGGVSFEVSNLTFRNGNASSAPNDNGGALAILTDESQQPNEHATFIAINSSEFFSPTR